MPVWDEYPEYFRGLRELRQLWPMPGDAWRYEQACFSEPLSQSDADTGSALCLLPDDKDLDGYTVDDVDGRTKPHAGDAADQLVVGFRENR